MSAENTSRDNGPYCVPASGWKTFVSLAPWAAIILTVLLYLGSAIGDKAGIEARLKHVEIQIAGLADLKADIAVVKKSLERIEKHLEKGN